MIYVKKIWILLAGALLLTACQGDDLLIDNPSVGTGEIGNDSLMPVHLRFTTLDEDLVDTRAASMVSGNEETITDIKMMCFSQTGNFLGLFNAQVHPESKFTGTIDGEVDARTTKVHFIANHPNLVVSQAANYLREMRDVIKDKALCIDYKNSTKMTYWTYHATNTEQEMQEFLNPQTGDEYIHFLRDRVKLTAEEVADSVLSEADPAITKIEWMVSNGLTKAYVVPWHTFDNGTDFINTDIDQTFYIDGGQYNKIKLTPYEKNDRDRYTNNDEDGFVEFKPENPLYVFEDYNNGTYDGNQQEIASNKMAQVKLIFRVTYGNQQPVYHVVKIMDANSNPYRLTRNHDYRVSIRHLKKTRGVYTSFPDALNTTVFTNDPFADIAPLVPEVSTDTKTLTILGGTTRELNTTVVDENRRYTVYYTFMQGTTGVSDAQIIYDGLVDANGVEDENAKLVASNYNTSTGAGSFTVELKKDIPDVGATPLMFTVRVYDKVSRLYRKVLFYVTNGFTYSSTPTMSRRTNDGYNSTYQLDVTLPATYPDGLYPITLVMGTRTLTPVSIVTVSGTTETPLEGAFEVAVESTGTDGWKYTGSNTTTDWNYNANNWNYVYKFKIMEKPTDNEGNFSTQPTTYRIIFKDNREQIGLNQNNTNVGLYFQVENFGAGSQISRYGRETFNN